ncbi:hypothetical protein KQX54_017349 [Cotesia glomerata]|uniref:Uncharacterized protein n=1 Tax=Cotesia glomerata TaxID=32391 RepID=A0AAV7IG72_COTGL|nr:hypothetical protein KQX54_017349 [Cotesia glomerata]
MYLGATSAFEFTSLVTASSRPDFSYKTSLNPNNASKDSNSTQLMHISLSSNFMIMIHDHDYKILQYPAEWSVMRYDTGCLVKR